MEKVERNEMIEALKERLEYFNDERLKLLYKSTTPVTGEDIADHIRRLSKNIPKDTVRRF